MLKSTLVVNNDRAQTHTQLLLLHSLDHLFSVIHWRTLRNGPRKRFTAYCDTHSEFFIMVAKRWLPLVVICCALGALGSLLDSSFVVVDSWPRALSCEGVCWTVFAGPLLFVVRVTDDFACGETQEKHLRNLILSRSDVDDHGACGHPTSTRGIQSSSTSGSRIWTCRCSASYRQARYSSSSEGYSESHGTSVGIHWTRGGCPTVVEEDGGILCWCDQGVWDDVGVGCWATDGNHDDSDWSRAFADGCERCQRSAKPGVCAAAHSWLSRVMKRMTLSPTRGRIHWRHGGDCRSDLIRRQEDDNETFCARSFILDDALFWSSNPLREKDEG